MICILIFLQKDSHGFRCNLYSPARYHNLHSSVARLNRDSVPFRVYGPLHRSDRNLHTGL